MKRIRFTIAGTHPLLHEVRHHLIVNRLMHLVEPGDSEDFAIIGAAKEDAGPADTVKLFAEIGAIDPSVPVLLLSSDAVYSDKDDTGEVSENKPMSEDRASVIPSVLDERAPSALFTLTAESTVLRTHEHVLVLRTFPVYGATSHDIINHFLGCAQKGHSLRVESPGYQTKTFLHMDDFLVAFDRLVPKFLKGARGLYNIGSTEEISLKRLADSIWQLTNPTGGTTPVELVPPRGRHVWWVTPDTTRIQVLLNWKPQITLRKGLWTLVNEGNNAGQRDKVLHV